MWQKRGIESQACARYTPAAVGSIAASKGFQCLPCWDTCFRVLCRTFDRKFRGLPIWMSKYDLELTATDLPTSFLHWEVALRFRFVFSVLSFCFRFVLFLIVTSKPLSTVHDTSHPAAGLGERGGGMREGPGSVRDRLLRWIPSRLRTRL